MRISHHRLKIKYSATRRNRSSSLGQWKGLQQWWIPHSIKRARRVEIETLLWIKLRSQEWRDQEISLWHLHSLLLRNLSPNSRSDWTLKRLPELVWRRARWPFSMTAVLLNLVEVEWVMMFNIAASNWSIRWGTSQNRTQTFSQRGRSSVKPLQNSQRRLVLTLISKKWRKSLTSLWTLMFSTWSIGDPQQGQRSQEQILHEPLPKRSLKTGQSCAT